MASSSEYNRIPENCLKLTLMVRFRHPQECLAAHLIYESAEVLSGTKPANLVALPNMQRFCGTNLYEAWQQHGHSISSQLNGLSICIMASSDRNILLLCYDREHLESHLSHPGIRKLLARSGYDISQGLSQLLEELRRRIAGTGGFPHEVGLFIGYPAKDVAAFMGVIKIPFTCQGPWKIFGNPRESLQLAERHKQSRLEIGRKLERCSTPFDCLKQTGSAFF